jgi:uncharacterized membrane protein YagU involved in acid resistance
MHKVTRGAIAGTIATIPMTLVMINFFRRLPLEQRYPLPPRLIIESLQESGQMRPSMDDASATHTTLLAHFTYGAVTGALFPYLERGRGHDFFTGAAFGVGVWAASYMGWIPAANILTPATRHPPKRNVLMVTAHLAWGAALAGVSAALRPISRSQGRGTEAARAITLAACGRTKPYCRAKSPFPGGRKLRDFGRAGIASLRS